LSQLFRVRWSATAVVPFLACLPPQDLAAWAEALTAAERQIQSPFVAGTARKVSAILTALGCGVGQPATDSELQADDPDDPGKSSDPDSVSIVPVDIIRFSTASSSSGSLEALVHMGIQQQNRPDVARMSLMSKGLDHIVTSCVRGEIAPLFPVRTVLNALSRLVSHQVDK
jgi:hypothetical protein